MYEVRSSLFAGGGGGDILYAQQAGSSKASAAVRGEEGFYRGRDIHAAQCFSTSSRPMYVLLQIVRNSSSCSDLCLV